MPNFRCHLRILRVIILALQKGGQSMLRALSQACWLEDCVLYLPLLQMLNRSFMPWQGPLLTSTQPIKPSSSTPTTARKDSSKRRRCRTVARLLQGPQSGGDSCRSLLQKRDSRDRLLLRRRRRANGHRIAGSRRGPASEDQRLGYQFNRHQHLLTIKDSAGVTSPSILIQRQWPRLPSERWQGKGSILRRATKCG